MLYVVIQDCDARNIHGLVYYLELVVPDDKYDCKVN